MTLASAGMARLSQHEICLSASSGTPVCRAVCCRTELRNVPGCSRWPRSMGYMVVLSSERAMRVVACEFACIVQRE
jgi:hypothetical protein